MLLRAAVLTVFLITSAHAAGGTGAGVPVKRIVPPEHVIEGVRSLQVNDFAGRGGTGIAMEIRAGLHDTERLATDAAAVAKEAAKAGADVASKLAGSAVGGGIQGKIVEGLTKNVATGIQDELEVEPVIIDDGLKLDVFEVKTGDADGILSGSVTVRQETSDYTQKVARKDSDGNLVKDSEGKSVYDEIPCKRRKVDVEIAWSVSKGGQAVIGKSFVKKNGDSRCGADVQYLASVDALADAVIPGTGTRIVRLIAPSWKVARLPMARDRTLKAELKLIRAGEHFKAMCGFRGLLSFDESHSAATLNLGVVEEALGYYDLAAEQYKQANALRPDKLRSKAVKRIATRVKNVDNMVAAYGLTWKIGDSPDFAACPPIPDGRRAFVKKETALMTAAKGGDKILELAKGTAVFVLDESAATFRVALLDGTEGWIDSKRLK